MAYRRMNAQERKSISRWIQDGQPQREIALRLGPILEASAARSATTQLWIDPDGN